MGEQESPRSTDGSSSLLPEIRIKVQAVAYVYGLDNRIKP